MPSVNRVMFLVSSILQVLYAALAEESRKCLGHLEECGNHETCLQVAQNDDIPFQGVCSCLSGFHREGTDCVVNSPISSPSTSEPILGSIATALLWTVGVLAALAATLALLIRRYALLDRLYALRVRRYDTVFVSTAANVDDDAPIT
uniref:EGF-like domain-containing protein n=1 Tax=Lygus hesperus TaxID=30085 RepID=A0A146M2T7_LYGHE